MHLKLNFSYEAKGRKVNPSNVIGQTFFEGGKQKREVYAKEIIAWKTSLGIPGCCTLDNTCVQESVYCGGEREKRKKGEKEKPGERKRVHSKTHDRPAPQSMYPQLLCCAKPGAQPQAIENIQQD